MQKKEININIGRRIQQVREERRYTQEQLAERLDVGVQHISNIERGVTGISLAALTQVCIILETTADYLLFGTYSSVGDIDKRIAALPAEQAQIVREIIENTLKLTENTQK